jgi:hypothetical protein
MKKNIMIIFFLLLSSTFFTPAGVGAQKERNVTPRVWPAISSNSPIVTFAQRESLTITFALLNDGSGTIEPRSLNNRLLINEKPVNWTERIFVEGPQDRKWKNLEAGEFILKGIKLGGRFQTSGKYVLIWEVDGFRSDPITIRILPN